MPTVGPWVQPDDVSMSAPLNLNLWWTAYSADGTYIVLRQSMLSQSAASSGSPGPGASAWENYVVIASHVTLGTPPVEPDPPPGATLELEAEFGTLLVARLRGTLENTYLDGGTGGPTPIAGVWQLPTSRIVAEGASAPLNGGVGVGVFLTTQVDSTTGLGQGTIQEFATPDQDVVAAGGAVGWQIGTTYSADWTDMDPWPGMLYQLRVFGPLDEIGDLLFDYTYRPPRYRFIREGRTPTRGHQRASGVMGSIPLRGRQGDKWGLRGRQNSNL